MIVSTNGNGDGQAVAVQKTEAEIAREVLDAGAKSFCLKCRHVAKGKPAKKSRTHSRANARNRIDTLVGNPAFVGLFRDMINRARMFRDQNMLQEAKFVATSALTMALHARFAYVRGTVHAVVLSPDDYAKWLFERGAMTEAEVRAIHSSTDPGTGHDKHAISGLIGLSEIIFEGITSTFPEIAHVEEEPPKENAGRFNRIMRRLMAIHEHM